MKESSNINNKLNSWLQDTEEYQAGKTFEYVMQRYGFAREEILRLAGNESTIGTSPIAVQAATQVITSSNYYDEPRSESLIEALEDDFAARGFDMSKCGIVVGNGMDSIIEHVLKLFTDEHSAVMNFTPTFIYYEFAAKRRGVQIIEVPRKPVKEGLWCSYRLDWGAALAAIQPNLKVVFLCTPNNPDGSAVNPESLEMFAEELHRRGIVFFVDHAYIEFADSQYDLSKLVEKYPNVIIGYTFSKAYALAGFRVGYALMSKALQAKYLSLITPFLCSKPSLAAAKAALQDTEHLQYIVQNNIIGRDYLTKELLSLGATVYHSETNFVLFEYRKTASSLILERLMSQAIIIRAISTVSNYALRVTVGTPEENSRFIHSLKAVIAQL